DRRSRTHDVDDDGDVRGPRFLRRESDVRPHLGTTLMSMAAAMRCYRHPDRETYVSCSECGRPICTECMTPAPVGQRCPEHSGKLQGVARVTTGMKRASHTGTGALVTKALIGINVLVYLGELAQGAGLNANSGSIYIKG